MASKNKKKNKGAEKQQDGFPVVGVIATLAVIAIGVAVGVFIWSQSGSGDDELVDDIELPSFTRSAEAPPDTEKAYRIALTIPDDLEQIPCYCGCGESADHQNNLDCFIEQRNGDNVIFDDHAAY